MKATKCLPYLLVAYLFVAGLFAIMFLVLIFPEVKPGVAPKTLPCLNLDQTLIIVSILSGIAGSFIAAAQSLSSYLGNGTFKPSWTVWYFLRPWIGGMLGLAIFFTFRAGLVASVDAVNPYGVAALGLLGGWFSKSATDKLREVFETLFDSDADEEREDSLKPKKDSESV
ncbi:MAG: hypothetical protein ACSHX8_14650 [Opitutaceae bacterium]